MPPINCSATCSTTAWCWCWEDQVWRRVRPNCSAVWDFRSHCKSLLVQRWNADLPKEGTRQWITKQQQQRVLGPTVTWLVWWKEWNLGWQSGSYGRERWFPQYFSTHVISAAYVKLSPSLLCFLWLCPNSRAVSLWWWECCDSWSICPIHCGCQRWFNIFHHQSSILTQLINATNSSGEFIISPIISGICSILFSPIRKLISQP